MFVRVTVCAALVVPSSWLANDKLTGLAAAATIPLPVTLTVGLTFALSLIATVPLRLPATLGVKKTVTLQLAPAAKVLEPVGQVLVVVKSARLIEICEIFRGSFWLLVTVTLEGALLRPIG